MNGPLGGLAPARRRLVLVVLSLILVVGILVVAGLVVDRVRGDATADQSRLGPVVLIPGYGADMATLDPLEEELRDLGREVVVFTPTEGGQGDLRVQAERLAALVEDTQESDDASSVDLVGYSAGGVIARLYVREEGGGSVVRRVLTLGSPHHGSEVADLGSEAAGGCPEACEQLTTTSDLLRRLNAGDETPEGPLWTSVRTDADETVTPVESAVLDGALNFRVQDLCPDSTTSHGALPGDPVVLATLASALGTKEPEEPDDVTC